MPELPEVETIRRDLEHLIVGNKIVDIESDWPKTVKEPEYDLFKGLLIGRKITGVKRRAKNLIIELDRDYLLVHFKMTGHLLVAEAKYLNKNNWNIKDKDSVLADSRNQYIHLALYLDDKRVIALSDLRKFARVSLVTKERLDELLKNIGPEPLEANFTFEIFKSRLKGKKGAIKKVLLEQDVIAGIGNIYADEILFESGVAPYNSVISLNEDQLMRIYKNIISVLQKALSLRGTSSSDYRDASGKKGSFGDVAKVYRKTGEPCPNECGGLVMRMKINGRSSHYCELCQK